MNSFEIAGGIKGNTGFYHRWVLQWSTNPLIISSSFHFQFAHNHIFQDDFVDVEQIISLYCLASWHQLLKKESSRVFFLGELHAEGSEWRADFTMG